MLEPQEQPLSTCRIENPIWIRLWSSGFAHPWSRSNEDLVLLWRPAHHQDKLVLLVFEYIYNHFLKAPSWDWTALNVPSDRPERWPHTWTLEAFRWLCTWPVQESDPGSPRTWWRSPWKQEAGWLLLPASTTQTQRRKRLQLLGKEQQTTEKVPAVFRWASLWGRCRHICCHDNVNNSLPLLKQILSYTK